MDGCLAHVAGCLPSHLGCFLLVLSLPSLILSVRFPSFSRGRSDVFLLTTPLNEVGGEISLE